MFYSIRQKERKAPFPEGWWEEVRWKPDYQNRLRCQIWCDGHYQATTSTPRVSSLSLHWFYLLVYSLVDWWWCWLSLVIANFLDKIVVGTAHGAELCTIWSLSIVNILYYVHVWTFNHRHLVISCMQTCCCIEQVLNRTEFLECVASFVFLCVVCANHKINDVASYVHACAKNSTYIVAVWLAIWQNGRH